jgi:hypothetical protein
LPFAKTAHPGIALPATRFSDIHSDRRGGASHLARQTKHLVAREVLAGCVNIESKSMRLFPNAEIAKTLQYNLSVLLKADS